jgi:rod shape-determining protein MreD
MMIRENVEPRIEVHKFNAWIVFLVAFTALVLQAFLPVYLPQARLLELPLLVTLYFGLSRRNPAAGLLLGMTIGLLQDALSGPRVPLGLFGIAKTLVGYFASTVGGRLDVDHPASRFFLAFAFYHVHQIIVVFTTRTLLAADEPYFSAAALLASVVNAIIAAVAFPFLDKLRKS